MTHAFAKLYVAAGLGLAAVTALNTPLLAAGTPSSPTPITSGDDAAARDAAAKAALESTADVVVVHADGVCCMGCAGPIRKKAKGLAFIDRARLDDGFRFDPDHSLVTIAIVKGQTVDTKALFAAMTKAGHEALHTYALKGGELVTTTVRRDDAKR